MFNSGIISEVIQFYLSTDLLYLLSVLIVYECEFVLYVYSSDNILFVSVAILLVISLSTSNESSKAVLY